MLSFLYYFIMWPFILFGALVNFLIWEIFSDGRWKQRQRPPNPARMWQEQAIEMSRQLRELEYKSRRQMEDMEYKFREEFKRQEREISYLRSRK